MVKTVEDIIKKIESNPNVMAIILFGSHAKAEQKPISDIDIAVLLKDPAAEDEAEIGSFYSEKIDVVLFHRLPLYIKYEVMKTGKELMIRDENYYIEEKMKVLREYLEMERLYRQISRRVFK